MSQKPTWKFWYYIQKELTLRNIHIFKFELCLRRNKFSASQLWQFDAFSFHIQFHVLYNCSKKQLNILKVWFFFILLQLDKKNDTTLQQASYLVSLYENS